jgi:iron complex outermembrane receptor protein
MRSRWSAVAVLTFALAPAASAQQPAYAIDTVHVHVGSRASAALPVATRAVQVIRADEIRRSPARTVSELLAAAQGVDLMARSPAQADVAVRGSSFEQVLVLVDGVSVSDAQTGHFDLDLAVPLEQIERVEILRGSASALYGSAALGGVIHVVTRQGGAGIGARLEAGSFGTRTAALSLRGDVGGVHGDIAVERSEAAGHRAGTDYEMLQLRAALSAPLGARTLRADVAHAQRDFGAAGFYAANPAYDEYEETRTTTASLALAADPTAHLALEPRVSVRRHDDDFVLWRDDPARYRNQHTGWQLGGELVGRYAATPALRLVLGTEAYRDELRSASLGDRHEKRAALFAEAALGAAQRAALTAGLRADWHSAFGTFVAPSLAGAWWPSEALRLRASTSRAFRAPTWTERYYEDPANIATPELDPERAWSSEAGADLHLSSALQFGATAFVRRTDDLIDWARPVGSAVEVAWRTRNVRSATFRGLEGEARLADPLGTRWAAHGLLLRLSSADGVGLESKYALRPLDRSWSLAAERDLGAGIDALLRLRGARRAGEGTYRLLDARVSYTLGAARFFVDGHNLTDRAYADVLGHAAPGRAAFVGIEWRSRR